MDALGGILDGEPYHVGIVVDDVDAAMETYGQLFGMQWGHRMAATLAVELDGVRRDLPMDAVYSRSGPVRVELVKAQPGTIWATGSGTHHIGFWCDDVVATGDQLAAAGYPMAAALFPDPNGPYAIAMHRGPQGLYVEIVSSFLRPFMEPLWA